MASLPELRAQLALRNGGVDPYASMSDRELADRMYEKFYQQTIDREEFDKRIGYSAGIGERVSRKLFGAGELDQGIIPSFSESVGLTGVSGDPNKPRPDRQEVERSMADAVFTMAKRTKLGMQLQEFNDLKAAGRSSPLVEKKIADLTFELQKLDEFEQNFALQNPTAMQRVLPQIASSVAITVPSILLAGLTKSPAIGTVSLYPTTQAEAYGRLNAKGVPHELAKKHGAFQGGVEVATELMPFIRLLEKTGLGTKMIRTIFADIPGELGAQLMQGGSDYVAERQAKGEKLTPQMAIDGLAEASKGLPDTVLTTLGAAGLQVGVARAVQIPGERKRKREEEAERTRRGLDDLADELGAAGLGQPPPPPPGAGPGEVFQTAAEQATQPNRALGSDDAPVEGPEAQYLKTPKSRSLFREFKRLQSNIEQLMAVFDAMPPGSPEAAAFWNESIYPLQQRAYELDNVELATELTGKPIDEVMRRPPPEKISPDPNYRARPASEQAPPQPPPPPEPPQPQQAAPEPPAQPAPPPAAPPQEAPIAPEEPAVRPAFDAQALADSLLAKPEIAAGVEKDRLANREKILAGQQPEVAPEPEAAPAQDTTPRGRKAAYEQASTEERKVSRELSDLEFEAKRRALARFPEEERSKFWTEKGRQILKPVEDEELAKIPNRAELRSKVAAAKRKLRAAERALPKPKGGELSHRIKLPKARADVTIALQEYEGGIWGASINLSLPQSGQASAPSILWGDVYDSRDEAFAVMLKQVRATLGKTATTKTGSDAKAAAQLLKAIDQKQWVRTQKDEPATKFDKDRMQPAAEEAAAPVEEPAPKAEKPKVERKPTPEWFADNAKRVGRDMRRSFLPEAFTDPPSSESNKNVRSIAKKSAERAVENLDPEYQTPELVAQLEAAIWAIATGKKPAAFQAETKAEPKAEPKEKPKAGKLTPLQAHALKTAIKLREFTPSELIDKAGMGPGSMKPGTAGQTIKTTKVTVNTVQQLIDKGLLEVIEESDNFFTKLLGVVGQERTPRKQRKPPPQRRANAATMDILEFVAMTKLTDKYGIDIDHAEKQGLGRSEMNDARAFGFYRPFVKGGATFDQMAEALDEAGYPVREKMGTEMAYTPNRLLDLLDRALRGERIYSDHNTKAYEAMAEKHEAKQKEEAEKTYDPNTAGDHATQIQYFGKFNAGLDLAIDWAKSVDDYKTAYKDAYSSLEVNFAAKDWRGVTASLTELHALARAWSISPPDPAKYGFPAWPKVAEERGVYLYTKPAWTFSNLERSIESLGPQKAPAKQWLGLVKNLSQRGVKKEELQYTGLEEWLTWLSEKQRDDVITKDQVREYLNAHKLDVREELRGDLPVDEGKAAWIAERRALIDRQLSDYGLEVSEYTGPVSYMDSEVREALVRYNYRQQNSGAEVFKVTDKVGLVIGFVIVPYNYHAVYFTNSDGSSAAGDQFMGEKARDLVKAKGSLLAIELGRPSRVIEKEARHGYSYTVFKAENPRELIFWLPDIEPFDVHNLTHYGDVGPGRAIGWTRFGDYMDEQGNKWLALQEIQSHRFQEMEKRGGLKRLPPFSVDDVVIEEQLEAVHVRSADMRVRFYAYWAPEGLQQRQLILRVWKTDIPKGETPEQHIREHIENNIGDIRAYVAEVLKNSIVPDAPLKTQWVEYIFKRMLRWAAEHGYHGLTWPTSATQVEKWTGELRQRVDELALTRDDTSQTGLPHTKFIASRNNTVAFAGLMLDGRFIDGPAKGRTLADLVGTLNAKNLEQQAEKTGVGLIQGDDLQIGGGKFEEIYDRRTMKVAEKLAKQFGGKVTSLSIPGTANEGMGVGNAHALEIPEALRSNIMTSGFAVMEQKDLWGAQPEAQKKHEEKLSLQQKREEIEKKLAGDKTIPPDINRDGDLFSQQIQLDVESKPKVVTRVKRRGSRKSKLDVFFPAAPRPQMERQFDELSSKVALRTYGVIDAPKVVDSAETAAYIVSQVLGHAPQEQFISIVLDKKNKLLAVSRYSLGSIDGSQVDPLPVLGAIYSIPGATSVWFGHQHPSGIESASQADEHITQTLNRAMRGSGVSMTGHVVIAVGNDKATVLTGNYDAMPISYGTPTNAQMIEAPLVERWFESVYPPPSKMLTSPKAASDFIKDKNLDSGVLFLNSRHGVVGFVKMSPKEMSKLLTDDTATGGAALVRTANELNAVAAIGVVKGEPNDATHEALNNLRTFFQQFGNFRMLDGIFIKNNGDSYSQAQHGQDNMTELAANPLPQMAKIYAKVAEDILNWWQNKIGWRYGPLKNMLDQEKYLEERGKLQGRLHKVSLDIVRRLYRVLAKARNTPDEMAIYHFLTTKGANPSMIVDPKLRVAAMEVKRYFRRLGKLWVAYGVLSRQAVSTYEDAYLPRLYLRHVLGPGAFTDFGTGKKPSPLNWRKRRKDLDRLTREIVLGQIKDPSFLAAAGLATQLRDMHILNFLKYISKNQNWVQTRSFIMWQGKRVTPQWLMSEADQIEKQSQYYLPADRAAALALAAQMRQLAQGHMQRNTAIDPHLWRQIPNSPRYGHLRGMWVRKEIHNDIIGINLVLPEEAGILERLFTPSSTYSKLNSLWKLIHVVLNIPTVALNGLTNLFAMHLTGVPAWRVFTGELYFRVIRDIIQKGPYYRYARRMGLFDSSFAPTELRNIMDDWIKLQYEMRRGGLWGSLAHGRAVIDLLVRHTSNAYGMLEYLSKVAIMMDAHERRGISMRDAYLEAQDAIIDYTLVPRGIAMARNAPIGAPFITWMYRMIAVMSKAFVRRPWLFAMYTAVLPYLSVMLYGMLNDDDDDLDGEDVRIIMKLAPEWVRKNGHAFFWPVKDDLGRWQLIDASRIVPFGWMTKTAAVIMSDLPPQQKANELRRISGYGSGPILDPLIALITNKDPFRGTDVTNKSDPAHMQIAAFTSYMANMFVPPYLHGLAFGEQQGQAVQIKEAITGENVDYRTDEPRRTVGQSVSALFGVPVIPISEKHSPTALIRGFAYEIDEIKRRMKAQIRQADSPEEIAEIEAVYTKEIERRAQRIKEVEALEKQMKERRKEKEIS